MATPASDVSWRFFTPSQNSPRQINNAGIYCSVLWLTRSIMVLTGTSGDLNGDGGVNASDLQLEVNVILAPRPIQASRKADIKDSDRSINALDLQRLLNKILGRP